MDSRTFLDFTDNTLQDVEFIPDNWNDVEIIDMSRNTQVPIISQALQCLSSVPKLSKIILKECQLTAIPVQISIITNLTNLTICSNNLQTLNSDFFRNLTKLRTLDVSDNQLTGDLANMVSSLHSLEILIAHGNKLDLIGDSISNLSKLKQLIVPVNNIIWISQNIGKLRHLKVLWLHKNPIRNLPLELCRLRNLKDITIYGCNQLDVTLQGVANAGIQSIINAIQAQHEPEDDDEEESEPEEEEIEELEDLRFSDVVKLDSQWEKLSLSLDINDQWRKLGEQLQFQSDELDHIGQVKSKSFGHSPTLAMLKPWKEKTVATADFFLDAITRADNHTVKDLFQSWIVDQK